MTLAVPTCEAYPRCKHCGELITMPAGCPWVHYFTGNSKCYMRLTKAEPGPTRGGAHRVHVDVPGRQ